MGRIILRAICASAVVAALLSAAGCSDSSTGPSSGGGGSRDYDVWFVDVDATGSETGEDWENAFLHPADAMRASSAGDHIWVADGTYYGFGTPNVAVVSFRDSVSMYGGFEGGETDLSQRDFSNRAVFDGEGLLHNVVNGGDGALIHGITIRNGNATNPDVYGFSRGGGIFCYNESMRIARCSVSGCDAFLGGGIYIEGDSVVIDSCVVQGNHALETDIEGAGGGGVYVYEGKVLVRGGMVNQNHSVGIGGGILLYNSRAIMENTMICENNRDDPGIAGGGVYIHNAEAPWLRSEFTDCIICYNHMDKGGGVHLYAADAEFTGCDFTHNESTIPGTGSAVFAESGQFLLEHCELISNRGTAVSSIGRLSSAPSRLFNCLLIDNGRGTTYGGAIYNWGCSQVIEFCTIAQNQAVEGGGIYGTNGSNIYLANSIIWNNYAQTGEQQIQVINMGIATVVFSDIDQAGYVGPGLNNFRSDPLFTWVGMNGVYYLSHVACGQDSDSPCIDAADGTAASYGLDTWTTRTDFEVDTGTADIGFHHAVNDY